MADIDRMVVDASVCLSLVLPDEKATPVMNDLLSKGVEFVAPSLWFYEMSNGVRSAVAQKRIRDEDVSEIMGKISLLDVQFVDLVKSGEEVVKLALEKEISVYDASYVYLAMRDGLGFYTADKKLWEKIKDLIKVEFVD